MDKFNIFVPCISGSEACVERELYRLGYGETKAKRSRIRLKGDISDVAKLNVNLRTGDRVLIEVAEFTAETFDQLFEGMRAVRWENYISRDSLILMDVKSVDSKLGALKASGGVAKKAIIERLTSVYHCELNEQGERVRVLISIDNDRASVCLDTSGDGLHKRGYRTLAYSAPLKETLAAALIDMSVYNPSKILVDPFCGSGTIAIEAAMIARNIPAGANRNFDFANWHWVDRSHITNAREQAMSRIRDRVEGEILASDINSKAVSIAKYHAAAAGVDKDIHFAVKDARDLYDARSYGVIICNPPYGERMGNEEEVRELCADFGKAFRRLDNWSCYVLSGLEGFEKAFGERAIKNRKLFNANIPCRYYSYLGAKPPKQ